MKSRFFSLLACIMLFSNLHAQTKYAMFEHFTNTFCGTCASKNPAFFTTIAQYAPNVHHMSVHPSVPYINCTLHQYNTALNTERSEYYGINSTPRIALNGVKLPSSTPMLQVSYLTAALAETPVATVVVTETGSGLQRATQIEVKTIGTIPSGNYRLFVAMLEKTLNFTSPNNETVHHNVLRAMVTPTAGVAITMPAQLSTLSLSYNYTIPSDINASEVYVLAWVQNMDNKAILNSGTKFDPEVSTSTNAALQNIVVTATPNPMMDILRFTVETPVIEASLYDLSGKQVAQKNPVSVEDNYLNTNTLPAGVYVLRIRTEAGVGAVKVVK